MKTRKIPDGKIRCDACGGSGKCHKCKGAGKFPSTYYMGTTQAGKAKYKPVTLTCFCTEYSTTGYCITCDGKGWLDTSSSGGGDGVVARNGDYDVCVVPTDKPADCFAFPRVCYRKRKGSIWG